MGPRFKLLTGGSEGPSRADVHTGVPKVRKQPIWSEVLLYTSKADWLQPMLQGCPMEWSSEPHRRKFHPLWPHLHATEHLRTTRSKKTKDINRLWSLFQGLLMDRTR